MDTSDDLEFINRDDELNFLQKCLTKTDGHPALVVIRSPSGFGKSSLTDRLSSTSYLLGRAFCVVDPSIRGRAGAISVYDGFFLQRIAERLDEMAHTIIYDWPTLSDFLKQRKKQLLAAKSLFDLISEMPSLGQAYRLMFDYAARVFSFGRYAPTKLLVSDEAGAIAICSAYAEHIMERHKLIIVLREVQHIDLHSLRTLLLLSERHNDPDIIVEYSSESGQFEPEHQKLFLRAAEKRKDIKLLDLLRLNEDHLESLIRRNVSTDFNLTSDYYLTWDGNLRSIVELKFRVGIGQSLKDSKKIVHVLANITDTIADHIKNLTNLEKLLLAVVFAHIEPLSQSVIFGVIQRINPRERQSEVGRALALLEDRHFFLARSRASLSIRNDTISSALHKSEFMRGPIALSERALRDYYWETLTGQTSVDGFTESVRQYFRLCARTKDIHGLVHAVNHLSDKIKITQDQSIYVDVIATAIESDPDLYSGNYEGLIEWAAEVAYSTSDWQRVLKLLSLKDKGTAYSDLMRACALQEVGGHDKALVIVRSIRYKNSNPVVLLAADLIEALVVGCQGDHEITRKILESIVGSEIYSFSPLVGYAYRFFEIVDSLEDRLKHLKRSIEWFEKHNLPKSKAYSQLPTAMMLARLGNIEEAQDLLEEATYVLSKEIRDQYIILNNTGAVELLSDKPNFQRCRDIFNAALRFARDDFSELTILSNLSLAHLGLGEIKEASKCADECLAILEDHDFADTDIYWPVCFNMTVVYAAAGDEEKCNAARQFLFEKGRQRAEDAEYWRFRFGLAHTTVSESYRFLCKKKWHPLYLSHWLIDLEGLSLLKPAVH